VRDYEAVVAAKRDLGAALKERAGFVGAGVGSRDDGFVIVLLVEVGHDLDLPATYDGVPVTVRFVAAPEAA
jgi:hypothetical protein